MIKIDKTDMIYTYAIQIAINPNTDIHILLQNILKLQYLILIINDKSILNGGYIEYKSSTLDTVYKIHPSAILLLDKINIPTIGPNIVGGNFDGYKSIIINCKNSYKPYKISNLKILSPYIPIINLSNIATKRTYNKRLNFNDLII
jgi:hypothetical protein